MSPHDPDAIDTLDANEIRARGMTVDKFAEVLAGDVDLISRFRSEDAGVELKTIHGSKGLQWNNVVIFGADTGSLPHHRTLQDSDGDDDESATEDERRLAYVAFTRAQKHVTIVTTDLPSPFLVEAGIITEDQRQNVGSQARKRKAVNRPAFAGDSNL